MLTNLATLHRTGLIDLPTWFEQSVRQQKLAVDLQSGAYLIRSGGHGKGGLNYYYLHSAGKRRTIRAYSDAEAIDKSNQRGIARGASPRRD